MEQQSVQILLLEFETAWQQLFMIDNRRGTYMLCFSALFFLLGITVIVLSVLDVDVSVVTAAETTVVLLVHVLFGHHLLGVYDSERAANVRYRKKINLIREMLLSRDDDEFVRSFLEKKEIGIKTFSGAGNEIDQVGGTLTKIYSLIRMQQGAGVAMILLVWVDALAGR